MFKGAWWSFRRICCAFLREITSVGNPFRNGSGEWYNGKALMKCIKFIKQVHLYGLKKSKPVLSHTLLAPNGASRQPFGLRDGS